MRYQAVFQVDARRSIVTPITSLASGSRYCYRCMKNDLYRIDNILIHTGLALLVFAMLIALPALRMGIANSDSLASMWQLIAALAAPIVSLGAGIVMRRREMRIEAVWRMVVTHGQMPAEALCEMSGFSRPQLDKALQRVNRRASSRLSWNKKTDRVVDTSRGPQSRFAHSAQCAGCGASVSVDVTAQLAADEVHCSYCGRALDSGVLNNLQQQLMRRADQWGQQARVDSTGKWRMRFNLPIFVVLLVIFWPGALAYAVWRSWIARPVEFGGTTREHLARGDRINE